MSISHTEQTPHERKLNVIIIGGSLAGLMHGVMLTNLGHNVQILEQATTSVRHDYAAGMGIGPSGKTFFNDYDRHDEQLHFNCPGFLFLNHDDSTKSLRDLPMSLYFTGWDSLYYRLRAMFDGLPSTHLPKPRSDDHRGRADIKLGTKVTSVSLASDGFASVEYEPSFLTAGGRTTEVGGILQADLVIDASGANSLIRRHFFPDSHKKYAGFVGWRGTVPESDVSKTTRDLFNDEIRFLVYPTTNGYVVGYSMPGEDGNMDLGKRFLNWVWYDAISESDPFYTQIMTDSDGRLHRGTLPVGKMPEETQRIQHARTEKLLDPAFKELVLKTKQPFISTVRDSFTPGLIKLDGRLIFIGEAATLMRPNGGQAFDLCAQQCLLLRKVMQSEITLQEWESAVKASRTRAYYFSRILSDSYMSWKPRLWLTLLQLLSVIVWQKIAAQWTRAKL